MKRMRSPFPVMRTNQLTWIARQADADLAREVAYRDAVRRLESGAISFTDAAFRFCRDAYRTIQHELYRVGA